MDQFDEWLQRISEGKIDGALQSEIADKILELLEQKKASLSAREKTLFAQAITGLSINVNSIHQHAEVGLRRCLVALQKATNPESVPDELHSLGDDDGELTNYAMLVTTIEKVQEQICQERVVFPLSSE